MQTGTDPLRPAEKQLGAQLARVAMDRVAHDPGQQPLGQLRLGGKGRVRGQADRLQPGWLAGPALGQMEFRVQQCVPLRPRVGQEDPTWQFPPHPVPPCRSPSVLPRTPWLSQKDRHAPLAMTRARAKRPWWFGDDFQIDKSPFRKVVVNPKPRADQGAFSF